MAEDETTTAPAPPTVPTTVPVPAPPVKGAGGPPKTFHFIAGLPRSGSTLLCNILLQNPRFHATSTSGVIGMFHWLRDQWGLVSEFKATPAEQGRKALFNNILPNFYGHIDRPVVFDKSRGWPKLIETMEHFWEKKVKVIAPVRDVAEVCASFEKLWRKMHDLGKPIQDERQFPGKFASVSGRANHWMEPGSPVGSALTVLKDACDRLQKNGLSQRIHFVRFDELTNPKKARQTINAVYEFLGEDQYKDHDFNNVAQLTKEDDEIWGFDDLHTIRSKVEEVDPCADQVLGREVSSGIRALGLEFWKHLPGI